MKVVDANILIYSVSQKDRHYEAAHQWLKSALRGEETVGFPWVVLLAFVRIATKPVFDTPLTVGQAFDVVESWLAQPNAVLLEPSPRHVSTLRGLLNQVGTAGNLTTDAHIAALALEHGAEVVTFDRDFARFGVRHLIPG